MANTPQSKKRARQNERRFAINKARRSRIRTYLRKVEEAIASGDQDAAKSRPARSPAGTDARRHQGRPSQEHRGAQDLPLLGAGEGHGRLRQACNRSENWRPDGAPFLFSGNFFCFGTLTDGCLGFDF